MAADPSDPPEPFFIVGAPRSGTTLLRLLIGHHPQVCRCNELEFVTPALAAMRRGQMDLEGYREWLSTHRAFRDSGYHVDWTQPFEAIARGFLEQRRRTDGLPVVGATVHNRFDLLPELWPRARYIYIHRDPRDVALSSVRMGWCGTAYFGADVWLEAERRRQALLEQIPREAMHDIRFDALVSETAATLTDLCRFLGLEFDRAMLDIERDTSYSRPDPAFAGSWRVSAARSEIAEVETRIGGQTLLRWGYQPSGLQPMATHRLNLIRLRIRDFANRSRFRQKKYGFFLWAAHGLAKRVGSARMNARIRHRINEIDRRLLK